MTSDNKVAVVTFECAVIGEPPKLPQLKAAIDSNCSKTNKSLAALAELLSRLFNDLDATLKTLDARVDNDILSVAAVTGGAEN